MVIAILRFKTMPDKKTEVTDILNSLIGPTEVQPGCKSCQFYDNGVSDNEILLLQEWESKQRLESHISSDEFQKILVAMDLSSEAPVFAFHTVSKTEGLELVENLCK
jgi:quinol monooxygenase YgiN